MIILIDYNSNVILPDTLTEVVKQVLNTHTLPEICTMLAKVYEPRENSKVRILTSPRVSEEVQVYDVVKSWKKKRRLSENKSEAPNKRFLEDHCAKLISCEDYVKKKTECCKEKEQKEERRQNEAKRKIKPDIAIVNTEFVFVCLVEPNHTDGKAFKSAEEVEVHGRFEN